MRKKKSCHVGCPKDQYLGRFCLTSICCCSFLSSTVWTEQWGLHWISTQIFNVRGFQVSSRVLVLLFKQNDFLLLSVVMQYLKLQGEKTWVLVWLSTFESRYLILIILSSHCDLTCPHILSRYTDPKQNVRSGDLDGLQAWLLPPHSHISVSAPPTLCETSLIISNRFEKYLPSWHWPWSPHLPHPLRMSQQTHYQGLSPSG